MAFEWNWQPKPIETRLKDARSIAAAKAMEGYIPREADQFAYAPTPTVLAQEQMAGYVPFGANYNPQGVPTNNLPDTQPAYPGRAPQQFDNLGQGVIYQQQAMALKQEYAENEKRIAEIEQRIATLKGQVTGAGKELDNLDMQLAANRAGIGDVGNALAHQNRIITRQQMQNAKELDAKRDANANKETLEKELIDAYRELAWAETEQQQKVAQYNVDRLTEKYKNKYGEFPSPFATPKGRNLETVWGAYTNTFDKNGRPTDAAKEQFLKDAEGLPYSGALQEKIDQVRNATTQEDAADSGRKAAKAQQEAIDSITRDDINWMDLKPNSSYTVPYKKVTITITNLGGGKVRVQCGKKYKEISRDG